MIATLRAGEAVTTNGLITMAKELSTFMKGSRPGSTQILEDLFRAKVNEEAAKVKQAIGDIDSDKSSSAAIDSFWECQRSLFVAVHSHLSFGGEWADTLKLIGDALPVLGTGKAATAYLDDLDLFFSHEA
eukprot:2274283-Pyramimonas_sp.AAC.1